MSNNGGTGRKCAECGCKVRGSNHSEGKQHQQRVKKETATK